MRGLAVTSLSLSHFRSHRAARMEFDRRPVAFVGANGAGKTNLLEAISLLSPGRGLRRAAADEIARRPEALGWKVTATARGLHSDHEVETWAEGGASRQVRIDGKAATQVMLGRLLRIVWLVPAMDRLWTEAAEGRRRFLDRVTMSFFPDHAEAVLDYEKAMRERNRLLKEQVVDAHWHAALEKRMAEAARLIRAHREGAVARLAAAQAEAETAFPRAALSIASEDPEDLAAAWAEGRRRDMAAGRTLAGPHRADLTAIYDAKGIAAAQCSTGEQKALLISVVLANARALAEDLGAAPILLLDEVAAHLDEGRRAALFDEICALGAQAFMTGTGPELFAALGHRAQRIEVAEAAGLSETREIRP
ncbi:DNA replication/repair protein RecF [Rhodobacter sp. NSM]|uniref:DNA replication/repair protein RecF n=1 Tax=Rhodobacter sp. NSM TaxID=3457501 RepID=UPI003FD68212